MGCNGNCGGHTQGQISYNSFLKSANLVSNSRGNGNVTPKIATPSVPMKNIHNHVSHSNVFNAINK
jgi:hypothetical protein